MDDRTEIALREIVRIVGRDAPAGSAPLSADAEREIAGVLAREADAAGRRTQAISALAALAHAFKYPLTGADVARALIGAGLLTPAEFADLVRPHDARAADAALRPVPGLPCLTIDEAIRPLKHTENRA